MKRAACVVALSIASARAAPPIDPAVKSAIDAFEIGEVLRLRGERAASKPYFDKCDKLLFRIGKAGRATVAAKVDTSYGTYSLRELWLRCYDAKDRAADAGSRASAPPPRMSLAVSATFAGAPRSRFACGDHVYATLTVDNANDPYVPLQWSIDGRLQPLPPELVLQGDSSTAHVLPDPAVLEEAGESTYFYLRRIAELAPGRHAIELRVGAWDRPLARAAFTLDCPNGMAPYRAALDAVRDKHLSRVKWPLPLPSVAATRDEVKAAIAASHELATGERVRAFIAGEARVIDERGGHKRMISFYVVLERADGSCAYTSGTVEQHDHGTRRFGPRDVVVNWSEAAIRCADVARDP